MHNQAAALLFEIKQSRTRLVVPPTGESDEGISIFDLDLDLDLDLDATYR